MTPTPASNFELATAGEVLLLNGEPFMLWASCGELVTRLACVTCGVLLANQGQLELHVEGAPTTEHAIAAWCPRHGWEGGPPG
jgi:hypothetical protein